MMVLVTNLNVKNVKKNFIYNKITHVLPEQQKYKVVLYTPQIIIYVVNVLME